jgi:predicted nuclease with TOPRIM domain
MEIEATKMIGGIAGATGGGAFLIWFAKYMAGRLIKQYDEKHAEHEKNLAKISEKFTEALHNLDLKLARLEPLVTSAIQMRDDIKSIEGEVAVVEHRVNELTGDVNHAHKKLRELTPKLAVSDH